MNNKAAQEKTLQNEQPNSCSTQFFHSTLGEATGLFVSLGAVYLANHLLPNQTRAATNSLARTLGKWRGTHAGDQAVCARKMVDVALMNIGGLSNMGVQFTLHRATTDDGDKPTIASDLSRLLTGRIAGTGAAIATLALAQSHAPSAIARSEQQIAKLFGKTPASTRFAELLVSDLIQSAGAIAGNAPAQILYDRIMCSPLEKRRH